MSRTTTVHLPQLGDIEAAYELNREYSVSKPTCDARLTATVNLLAIEPLGHGSISLRSAGAREHFTYWDSAIMALEVMKGLGIKKAFAQGTSQGGVDCRADGAFGAGYGYSSECTILGLIPVGTHMDCESEDSQRKGCWRPLPQLKPLIDLWDSDCETPGFVVDESWCRVVGSGGFGPFATGENADFWVQTLQAIYQGDEGRRKVRMALICLLERDALLLRLRDIRCPVHWLQGTLDTEFGTTVPAEQIRLFTRSPEAKLEVVQGGTHYLSATHPEIVNAAILDMVGKYSGLN
ncbi:hypothetical protein BDW74DRAFT_182343 [Aspergillus multicolor]|uniref:alpha/beta fold hydrolase n=1 Tax=Aspergillus multicolor TaxID=41759 RepID=UPI003CCD9FF2